MWEYCGVVKNKELLLIGLQKIRAIKNKIKNLDIRIDEYSCKDLIFALDLESAVISSEATILSALTRKESRGAHQRNDFPKLNSAEDFNVSIELNKENNALTVSKLPLKELRKELSDLVLNNNQEASMKNKLLE